MYFASEINKKNRFETEDISKFLKNNDVIYDFPDVTFVVREAGEIIGTASMQDKVMKYFYVKDEYKGLGLMTILYNELVNFAMERNILDYYVFTKPKNLELFKGLGLKEVIMTKKVLLLEGGFGNYESWVSNIKNKLNENVSTRGAIVANCNPLTKGHKYLIEYAKKKVDELILFVVEEDKSMFTTKERFDIIKDEFKGSGIVVALGGPYIISSATFPTYFLKKVDDSTEIYTELDAKLFSEKIAKDLKIEIRFVGNEPADELTSRYNQSLKKYCEREGLKVEIVERLKDENGVISASKLRKFLQEGKIEEAFELSAPATKKYLQSQKGIEKINEIRNKEV